MDTAEIRSAVLATLESIAPELRVSELKGDQPLRSQLDLDSMDWLNVVLGLRERLGIDIPESAYGELATLESVVAYLARTAPAEGPRASMNERSAPTIEPREGTEYPVRTRRLNGSSTEIIIRPMKPDDVPMERDFIQRLSEESRYCRFMQPVLEIPKQKLEFLATIDYQRHMAFVATIKRAGREVEIGIALYAVDAEGTGCEFALAVDDDWQGTGVAGLLMAALMDAARAQGLKTMESIVLSSNHKMIKFARQLGFTVRRVPEDWQTVRVVRSL